MEIENIYVSDVGGKPQGMIKLNITIKIILLGTIMLFSLPCFKKIINNLFLFTCGYKHNNKVKYCGAAELKL